MYLHSLNGHGRKATRRHGRRIFFFYLFYGLQVGVSWLKISERTSDETEFPPSYVPCCQKANPNEAGSSGSTVHRQILHYFGDHTTTIVMEKVPVANLSYFFTWRSAERKTRVGIWYRFREKPSVLMWTSKCHSAAGFPFGIDVEIAPQHRYATFRRKCGKQLRYKITKGPER